jgi:hypothetical protein
MDAETRRFTAWLSLASAIVLVLGGFLFAFTEPGAVMVYTPFAAFAFAALLFLRAPLVAAIFVAVAIELVAVAYVVLVYR